MARDQFPLAWLSERWSLLRQRGAAAFQRVWKAAAPVGRRGLRTIKDASSKTYDCLRATTWQIIASRHWKLFLVIVAAILFIAIWKVPQWQAAGWQGLMEPKDLAKLQNDARTTLVQALGGAALLIGLYFTLKNLQLTQDRQITEHYTRAVEQLGSEKLEVRLGAIYALERIARDSERDYWPIMEILTAYVREHAYWDEESREALEDHDHSLRSRFFAEVGHREDEEHRELGPAPPRLATDIQAILTVLGRRTRSYGEEEDQPLDLTSTDLHEADLRRANLGGADLSQTNLRMANLCKADLRKANLSGAHLFFADFMGAQLQGANLFGATLYAARNLTLTVRSFLDQFQTLSYNSLIFGTLIQPDGNSTVHGWVQGAKQAKRRWTVNFKKLCYFKYLPNVDNRQKNERTVS